MSFLSYGSAAVAYGLLTLVLILRRDSPRQGQRVLVAVAGTSLWGLAMALILALAKPPELRFTVIPDALRTVLWIFCLLAALPAQGTWRSVRGVISATALLLTAITISRPFLAPQDSYANVTLLALSVAGCLTVEQIFRNSTPDQKQVLKPFLLAIGATLIYDVFVFSDAVLFNAVDTRFWVPRGLVAAAAVPFFVLAAKRHPDWIETLFVSREFVFYSATLTGVGIYLIAMAAGGFIIREQGGDWGSAIQAAYLVAALGVLAFILSSARLKSQARVFISKHFYRNRYDYREEWLRLIRTLSDSDPELPIEQRSIKALCAILESGGGQLWLDCDSRSVYEPFSAWQAPFPAGELSERSALVRFLKQYEWVIDSRQYARDPEHYQHAFRDEPAALPANSLIVPLVHQKELLGIMRLDCVATTRELNYEDHDLLKTAGRQVAAFLAHDLARERLAETRQFDAYHKLSTFIMHDLKNLLAQQALLVGNARKFRERPEFIDDVIRTVDGGVQRMRRLLRQLEQGAPASQVQRVELNKLILRAVSACSVEGKVPCLFGDHSTYWVRAHADQLTSVIAHLIQNAQDATTNGRAVAIRLEERLGGRVAIEIRDQGEGMSAEFIRHRLFKPFETTKGLSGMGIGAYQAREIVRGLGGELTVASEVGKGTTVSVLLPQEQPSHGYAGGSSAAV